MLSQENVDSIIEYLKKEAQFLNVKYIINENEEDIFMSNECIITFKKSKHVYLNFELSLSPDESAIITLTFDDVLKHELNLGYTVIIGDIFKFDNGYNLYYGDEAIMLENEDMEQEIEKRARTLNEMDNFLLTHEGFEC